MNARTNRWIIAGAIVALILGAILSRTIEPGVRVQKATIAEETPALEFLPASPGPHPLALLAHGLTASKETLFRYGEALAAAGFICYSVDLPGHGASPRTYTFMQAVHTLEAVAHEVGPVDVFAGDSLGGSTGGEAVREGGMRPGLFIAIGSSPALGDHAPPLLLLAGRFEEGPLALMKTRKDARLAISPWSDHLLEAFDPGLVNAAVEAACAAVHKTPPAPPTAWRWRLTGAVLAMLAAGKLASCLTDLFPQLARLRGLFIGVFIAVAFILTLGGRWIDATPHLRSQGIAMAVIFLLAVIASRLRIPRWSFAALGVLVMVIAAGWLKASGNHVAALLVIATVVLTPALIAGTVAGWIAARRGTRMQGDIAMAIIVGCTAFQGMQPPRTAPEAPKPHIAIKLDAKLLDACVGQYEFPPDNRFLVGVKRTIWRQGDQLKGQTTVMNKRYDTFEIYPESETNFFFKTFKTSWSRVDIAATGGTSSQGLTFIKNDRGEVTAVIFQRGQGLPDSEGKKLKNE